MNTLFDIALHQSLFLLFLTFVVGGIIISACFIQFTKKSAILSFPQILLLGVGISPYFTAILLYYLFLLLPNRSDGFYLIFIYSTYFILALVSFSSIKHLLKEISSRIKNIFIRNRLIFISGIIFFAFVFAGWSYYIKSKSLTEHDTLEYAVQGKIFYEDKTISYETHRYDEDNGFYYVGLHGLSFPLLATFERMNNSFLGSEKDYFFRSLNSIFGLFILLGIFLYSLHAKNIFFAIIMCIGLFFTYGFFETIMKYHIDNYRVFYLLCSIILMQKYIENNSFSTLFIFALFLSAQANAHSLGFMLAIIQIGILFLFIEGNIITKLKKTSQITSFMLIFGGIHYLIDIFSGTGWIFQDIKFY